MGVEALGLSNRQVAWIIADMQGASARRVGPAGSGTNAVTVGSTLAAPAIVGGDGGTGGIFPVIAVFSLADAGLI